jgi:hypothetical protein
MSRIDDILKALWDRINEVFSDQGYPAFKTNMLKIIGDQKITARQFEWEIRKRRVPL